jgi:putative tricarboxylic transport membrane protein
MSELLSNLAMGFGVAVSPYNILFCLLGALVGTLVGVLPGIGTVATIAMLLPITFGLPPVGALIMLAGIYYGAQYGGSTTSVLVNIPGEATSVITCLDGHQMARKGRAGTALAIAALGSFFAGCVATVLVAALGAPLTGLALLFGPAEYFSLMVLGLIFAVVLAKGSVLKAVAMVVCGLLMSMVGSDLETGAGRMTFDMPELADGIGFTNIAMGVFGFAEIIRNLELPSESRDVLKGKVTGLMPTRQDLIDASGAIARGTILGSILGILPGGGAVIASFAAYTFEKKISKHPERFGTGVIEGVAAPESANNAAAQTAFIPLLTLGIPPNAVMALMVGAMTIHGIVPGPQVMTKQPELFWGMIASMWLGNLMLVIINLPLVGVWVTLLRVPYRLMYPSIIVFCCIGIYSINNAPTDVVIAACYGLFGYWLIKHDFESAPLLLGFVLGPLMEENLRRAMLIARGDATVFLTRPISGGLLAVAFLLLVIAALPNIRKRRDQVFVE